jgi:hypothetical protein
VEQPATYPSDSPSEAGSLPNLIIIGAMKCGTTSLHRYLSHHPEVFMSRKKEVNFFVEHSNWSKGLDWYKSHFTEPRKVRGEASPNYTCHPLFPSLADKMHAILPDAKLIYCVRHPIKRMISHYVHEYSLGLENRGFEEAMLDPKDNPYLVRSMYFYQLEQYLKYYPASQIKVMVLEEMEQDPFSTLKEIFGFLEVDPNYKDSHRFSQVSRVMPAVKSRRRSPLKSWMVRRKMRGFFWIERNMPWLFGPPIEQPKVSVALRQELVMRLRDDVSALRDFTGSKLEQWQI